MQQLQMSSGDTEYIQAPEHNLIIETSVVFWDPHDKSHCYTVVGSIEKDKITPKHKPASLTPIVII